MHQRGWWWRDSNAVVFQGPKLGTAVLTARAEDGVPGVKLGKGDGVAACEEGAVRSGRGLRIRVA